MPLLLHTRYGEINVSRHAVDRWRQRTGRNLPQLVEAVATASRPTKQQLRLLHHPEPQHSDCVRQAKTESIR